MYPTYPNQSMQRRRLILLSIVVVVFVLGGLSAWRHYVVARPVTLSPTSNTTITVGTASAANSIKMTTKIISTSTTSIIRLMPGWYVVTFSGADYTSMSQSLRVASKVTISTPQLTFSDTKLHSILTQQSDNIHAVLKNLSAVSNYTIGYEKVYGDGTWYAATLIPPDTANQDTQRIVLHEASGQWQVAAGPALVFYRGDYKDIPGDILKNIDAQ